MIIERREHLTASGLQATGSARRRASLNIGLTPLLKEAFPQTKPVSRPLEKIPKLKILSDYQALFRGMVLS